MPSFSKSHAQVLIDPVGSALEESVKATVSGAVPVAFVNVNAATGAILGTGTVTVLVSIVTAVRANALPFNVAPLLTVIAVALRIFPKKCEDLSADNDSHGKNHSSSDLTEFQACRDIQILIADLEKIYHIIQKTGIIPNYLLILATFSKIIDNEKNTGISAINEKDRKKFESFIPGIADIIRKRIGPDAGWEAALFELMRIVRKFNAVFSDQKIDRNSISLIGPAVVFNFNTDIGYEEIQSKLDSFFEEWEFAEFESRLNNTLLLPDNDAGSEISDSVIFEALKSIAIRNIGSGYHDIVADPHLIRTADTDLHFISLPSVTDRIYKVITPFKRTFHRHPRKSGENTAGFDIDVSGTEKSLVIMPKKGERSHYGESGIPRYSIMFMAIVIFILFTITMAATSGIWNPIKSMNNITTGITANDPNTQVLQKIAALQKDVTALSAVQKSPPQLAKNNSASPGTAPSLTPSTGLSSADVNKHFFRIAFGPDNTKITKFPLDRIGLAIMGDTGDTDVSTVSEFIDMFNNHSYTTKISSFVKSGDQANIVLYFSPEDSIKNIESLSGMEISKDTKTGTIHYLHETVKTQYATTEIIYINADYKGDERAHWTLRGLLYELGFPGETSDTTDSIFYSESDNTTQLREIDWKSVELMYGRKITPGLTSDRVKAMLLL